MEWLLFRKDSEPTLDLLFPVNPETTFQEGFTGLIMENSHPTNLFHPSCKRIIRSCLSSENNPTFSSFRFRRPLISTKATE